MAQPPVTTPTLPVTQTPNEFIFSLYKSWYPEAQDKLPNDSLCFQSNWPFINLLFLHGWTKQQILGGLPCCAPAKERREKGWLIIKQIDNEHAPWLKNKPLPKQVYREFVLRGKKYIYIPPPLGVWIISRVKIRGSKAFPMWSNITSGTCAKKGKAQMDSLKRNTSSKGRWRVSPHWIHSVMPAQWQTFFHRVLHEMYPSPHYAYCGWLELYSVCVCVCVYAHVSVHV